MFHLSRDFSLLESNVKLFRVKMKASEGLQQWDSGRSVGLLSVPAAAGSGAKGWGEPDGADGEEAVKTRSFQR